MSTTKHTPGPWLAEGYDVRQDCRPAGGRMIAYCGPHHTTEAEYPAQCRAVDEANARLIAAAPGLLAALITAERIIFEQIKRDWIKLGYSEESAVCKAHDDMFVEECRAAIERAIAKAEGAK